LPEHGVIVHQKKADRLCANGFHNLFEPINADEQGIGVLSAAKPFSATC